MSEEIFSRRERATEILRRLKAGERGSDVARAVGVSRQYVSFLARKSLADDATPAPAVSIPQSKSREVTPERTASNPVPETVLPAGIERDPDLISPLAPRRRGRPRKGEEVGSPQTMTPAMLAQMARSNAAVARMMAHARGETVPEKSAEPDVATVATVASPVRLGPKLGRNDPCPLDPTRKFKRCCGATGETRCQKAPAPGATSDS